MIVNALAWGTFLIAFWTMLPQMRSIWKFRASPAALRGVSMLSLIIITVDYVAWSWYGLLVGAWAIWIPSVTGVVLTAITIAMLLRVRARGTALEGQGFE